MDYSTWNAWLTEPRAIRKMNGSRTRVLYFDNFSSHVDDPSAMEKMNQIKTKLRKFPPHATDRVQPADSFVIQTIKDAWRRLWDKFKFEHIRNGNWKDGNNGEGSGFLENPGKVYFLNLAADAVRDVNAQVDANGMNYARKSMIQCGLLLGVDGTWSESQLTQELQEIIAKHRPYFEGLPVNPEDVGTESDSE